MATKTKIKSTHIRVYTTSKHKLTQAAALITAKKGKLISPPKLLETILDRYIKREKLTIN
jgi:hypothetical protein